MKIVALILAVLVSGLARAEAQQKKSLSEAELLQQIDSLDGSAKKKPTPGGSPNAAAKAPAASKKAGAPGAEDDSPKGPTEITCTEEATFDNKTREAVFVGKVHVKDPQFTITCDQLTAILHDTGPAKAGTPNPAAPVPTAAPNGNGSAAGKKEDSGLERAIAEGNVVIVQDKPGEKKGEIKHYVGKAARAEYEAATGDVKLTGWPQIQQGINTQIATEESTVMYLNRDGRMRTEGASKTVIQEQTE